METTVHSFATMTDAVSALLVDVTTFLNSTGHEYLIVGGWAPFLRNTTSHVHPGTKDIDVLFSDGGVRKKLCDVIQGLLAKGYKASAKHDFQLLRSVKVQDHELIFNIDLLHPSESVRNPDMMVDHFDLGITDRELAESKAVKSIVLPSSALLFRDGFWTQYEFNGFDLDGTPSTVPLPLLGLAGSILSKAESVSAKKRPRDAFDIFLAIESDVHSEIPCLLRQYKHIEGVRELLDKLLEFLAQPPSDRDQPFNQFDLNVFQYLREQSGTATSPAKRVAEVLKDV